RNRPANAGPGATSPVFRRRHRPPAPKRPLRTTLPVTVKVGRMSDQPFAVVVVDDAPDVREVVGSALRLSGRFAVVGQGGTGREAVDLAARHHPDILLLEIGR